MESKSIFDFRFLIFDWVFQDLSIFNFIFLIFDLVFRDLRRDSIFISMQTDISAPEIPKPDVIFLVSLFSIYPYARYKL